MPDIWCGFDKKLVINKFIFNFCLVIFILPSFQQAGVKCHKLVVQSTHRPPTAV